MLASALADEFGYGSCVVRSYETRTREDGVTATCGVLVRSLQEHQYHRKVTLEVLLLIDGERNSAGVDLVDEVLGKVERSNDELNTAVLSGFECTKWNVWTGAEKAIDVWVCVELCGCLLYTSDAADE